MPLLDIQRLCLEFNSRRVLDEVSLTLAAGETVCLVGESGSGKTVTALSIARLLPSPPARYPAGQILLNGSDVLRLPARQLRHIRGGVVSYIFQDPAASLNPVRRVGKQVREALQLHRPDAATDEEVIRLFQCAGIPAPEWRVRDYPHQLSGGLQQRVMIAMALASHPQLLVADEPTTALDVTIQAQILDLLRNLKRQLGMSILLITHNLGLVSEMAGPAAVLYAGQIVEYAPATHLLARPLHPYTQALIRSVPELGRDHSRLVVIPGTVPPPGAWPAGCRFHPRCPKARADCARMTPALVQAEPGRTVRCPFWSETL